MEMNKEARAVYMKMIDNFVGDSDPVSSKLIRNQKIYSRAKGKERYNEFIAGLNEEQRILLADMLKEERVSAFHDILATLTWWIDCEDVTLHHRGNIMPIQLSGMGLHGDYIGRLEDWEWPDE